MAWALLFSAPALAADITGCPYDFEKLDRKMVVSDLIAKKHWQEAAWAALEGGDKKHAREIEAEIEHVLRTAPVEGDLTYPGSGSSEVFKVELHGIAAIFKPDIKHWKRRIREFHGDDMPEKEEAAYFFDRAIGANMVPVTIRREVNGIEGSLQVFVHMDEKFGTYAQRQSSLRNEPRLAVLDFMMNAHDRTPNNRPAMLGSPVAIDNAMAFLEQSPHRGHGIQNPPRLEEIQKIEKYGPALSSFKDINLEEVRLALQGKLTESQVNGAVERARIVKELGQKYAAEHSKL